MIKMNIYKCLLHTYVLQQINIKLISKMINNMINNALSSSVYNKMEAIEYKYIQW